MARSLRSCFFLVTLWPGCVSAFDLSPVGELDSDCQRTDAFEQQSCLQVRMFETGQLSRDVRCNASDLQGLLKVVRSQAFRNNSCIAAGEWSSLADGTEDINDVWEWAEVIEAKKEKQCKHEKLPTLLYLGLNHAGSTSISSILDRVPRWSKGTKKEHRFFARSALDYLGRSDGTYTRTFDEYREQYTVGCEINQTFDASPFYWAIGNEKLRGRQAREDVFHFPPGRNSLRGMKRFLGRNLKFVFTIRDPVAWLSSMRAVGNEKAERLMCVADSVEGWLEEFPRKQFLFLDFDHMFEDLPRTINAIMHHAGYPPLHPEQIPVRAASGRRRSHRTANASYTNYYHAKYYDCKQRLQKLTGLTFEWGL